MIVLDLDNCISDDRWRRPMIDWKTMDLNARYERYHAACSRDKPAHDHVWAQRSDIIVITSRPEKFRAATVAWLSWHGVRQELLLMRPNGNTEQSVLIKERHVKSLLIDGHNISTAYDDRHDIIAAYQAMGIKAVRLAIDDEGDSL